MSTAEPQISRQGPAGMTKDDVKDLVQEFLGKRNLQPEQGVGTLLAENAELRGDKRALKQKLEDALAKVPAEGSLVLSGDALKVHNELVKILGDRKPEELVAVVKEHGELKTKVAGLEHETLINRIAEAEGWKPATLLRLTQGMDLVLEEVDEQVDDPDKEGEKKLVKVSRGFIAVRDAANNVTGKKPLRDELKEFAASLAKEHSDTDSEGNDKSQSGGGQGTPFVRQSSGTKGAGSQKSVSKNFLGKRYGTEKKKE